MGGEKKFQPDQSICFFGVFQMLEENIRSNYLVFLQQKNVMNAQGILEGSLALIAALQHRYKYPPGPVGMEILIDMRDKKHLNKVSTAQWVYARDIIAFIMPKVVNDFTISMDVLHLQVKFYLCNLFGLKSDATAWTLSRCLPFKKIVDFIFHKALREQLEDPVDLNKLVEWFSRGELDPLYLPTDFLLRKAVAKLAVALNTQLLMMVVAH